MGAHVEAGQADQGGGGQGEGAGREAEPGIGQRLTKAHRADRSRRKSVPVSRNPRMLPEPRHAIVGTTPTVGGDDG